MSRVHHEIETHAAFERLLAEGHPLTRLIVQGLDLTAYTAALLSASLDDSVFLGCTFTPEARDHVFDSKALVFPAVPDVPYPVYPNALYRVETLMSGYEPGRPESFHETLDERIYQHYRSTGATRSPILLETLCRRLHDHGITDALDETIEDRTVVAVMGGHGMRRDDARYRDVALIARMLAQDGFLLASGGGPGAMEATNLGAYFAHRSVAELDDALALLARAPHYKPREAWLDAAFAVRLRYPLDDEDAVLSVGIPTWHYGHEPPNVFATHIAKYFANSVREEGLLAIATGGVLFAPGSAGTIQEIFQDAAQNHYNTVGVVSPMMFLDETYWTITKPVYPLLRHLAEGHAYARLLAITDDPDEAVEFIHRNARNSECGMRNADWSR